MITDIAGADGLIACDICIVGSGVVGQALMREFDGTGLSVVVLESGGITREAAIDDLQAGIVRGSHFAGITDGRARQFGGTSNLWGGQALPMDPIDFQVRDWVLHSGWPIALETVSRHYARAAAYLGIDQNDFDRDVLTRFAIGQPDWLPVTDFRYHISKWAPEPRLIDRYRRQIERSADIRVLLHATLTDIGLSPSGGHVDHVVARNLDGRSVRVQASRFVLASGAIETARILLVASARGGRPIGDGHAHVGRYLLDHPSGPIGRVLPSDESAVQRLFNMFYTGRRKYSARLSLGEAAQHRGQLLNVSCGFNFAGGPGQPIDILRRGLGAIRARDLRALTRSSAQAIRALPAVAHWGYHRAIRQRAVYPHAAIELVVNCEQAPQASNRVALAMQSDALGIPRSEISWQPGDAAETTARAFARSLATAFARSDIGRLALQPWIDDEAQPTPLLDAFHPMGTTRMASSARDGVVDADCRLFGVDNLWIAGTAPFPTGGHSNPTFTAIALALRLADTLKANRT